MRRVAHRALRLRPGDRVGVVSPGFAVAPEALRSGLRAIARMGFEPVAGAHAADLDGYFAGADADRASDLDAAVRDPSIRGIWFARGGYGTARLLDRIDWGAIARHPKIWVGFSDLTALFAAIVRRTGQVCLHGPVVANLGVPGGYHAPSLSAMLAGRGVTLPLRAKQVLAAGRARGRLVGGNLTVFAHLLGTPYAPDVRGAVLLLEESGEEAYRVDRLLTHLRQAGVFRDLAAVLVGDVGAPASTRVYPPDRPVAEVLREVLSGLGVPVVTGLPIGHIPRKWSVPLGGTVSIDTARGTIRFDPRPAREAGSGRG